MRDGVVAQQLKDESIDLAIVIAYGRILPKELFEAPQFNTWNVHTSLLPRHRGASPIQHAVLSGDEVTGVTLMQIEEGLDEGPMLLQTSTSIDPDETAGQLTSRLAVLGAQIVLDGLQQAKSKGLQITPQIHDHASFAPLLEKKDGELDLNMSAKQLALRVRGLSPWPGTYLNTKDGPLKILAAKPYMANLETEASHTPPGIVHQLKPLLIGTGEGLLEIDQLQAPGRKPVQAQDFLRGSGRNLRVGQPLEAS